MNLKNLIYLFVGATLLWSCSDDDDPQFEGSDNHILSFSLVSSSGERYIGEIADNVINISVPQNVSLAGAKPQYTLCELSTISPRPENVTDWTNSPKFTVTSYSNATRDYYVKVNFEPVATAGSITLATQADVDALAATGISIIDGDLIVGTNLNDTENPVTDLSALSSITEVRQNIIIRHSFAGSSLDGLQNIKSAAGLFIGEHSSPLVTEQEFTADLPSLKDVGQLVINSNNVTSINLNSLQSAGWIYISGHELQSIGLDALKTCTTNFTFAQSNTSSGQKTEKISLPSLENVGSNFLISYYAVTDLDIPKLSSVGGKIDIRNLSNCKTVNIPSLKQVGGEMIIQYSNNIEKLSLKNLETVNGKLTINLSYCSLLSVFEMENLKTVNGDATIQFGENAENTSGFSVSKLEQVKSRLEIRYYKGSELDISSLSDCATLYLYVLPNIKSIDVTKNSGLNTLSVISCTSVEKIKSNSVIDYVEINAGQEKLSSIEFDGLKEVTSTLDFSNLRHNDELHVPGIQKVGRLYLRSINGVKNLSMDDLESATDLYITSSDIIDISFPKLKEITGNAYFSSWKNITSSHINFNSLTTIGGTLNMEGYYDAKSSILDNMDFLQSLTSVKTVSIQSFPLLSDFSGLKNALDGISSWSVRRCAYNPTLADMKDGKYTLQEN